MSVSVLMDACLFCPKMFPNDEDTVISAGSLFYFAILTSTKSVQPNLNLPWITSSMLFLASNDHDYQECVAKKVKRTIV